MSFFDLFGVPKYKTDTYGRDGLSIVRMVFVTSDHGFSPCGGPDDWARMAIEYKKDHPNETVEVFFESIDKQTGQTSTTLIPNDFIASRENKPTE